MTRREYLPNRPSYLLDDPIGQGIELTFCPLDHTCFERKSSFKTRCHREGLQLRDARRFCTLVLRKCPAKVFISLKHLFPTCKTGRRKLVFCDFCLSEVVWVTSKATSTLGKGRQSSPDCSAHWWHLGCSFPFLRHFLHPRKRGRSKGYKNREGNNYIRRIHTELQSFKRKVMAVTLSLLRNWHLVD